MGTERARPVDVVKAFLAAMEKLDYDTALSLVSDDCEYVNVPLSTVRGPAGIRSVLEPFFAPTLENQWVVRTIAAEGPLVFVERLDRHRLPGGWRSCRWWGSGRSATAASPPGGTTSIRAPWRRRSRSTPERRPTAQAKPSRRHVISTIPGTTSALARSITRPCRSIVVIGTRPEA